MRKLTKSVSIVLVLVMVMLLAGCSSEKSAVLGTWEAEMNLADLINQGMVSEDEELAQYLSVDTFYVTIVLAFKDDNTYSMSLDESKLNASFQQLKADVQAGLEQYLLDMVASMGLEMSVDDLMAAMGISMEDLMNEAFTEDIFQNVLDSARSEGKFKVKDGKFYLSAGLNYEVEDSVYGHYEVDGNKQTLLDYNGEEEEFLDMYPIVFTKAG